MENNKVIKFTKEELANLIKNRVVIIGTDLKILDSIVKNAKNNPQFSDAFATLYLSLQNTVYIELFKLFDKSGEDAKKYNIYALIDLIEDDNKSFSKMISPYREDIESIKNRRNNLYGHELGKNGEDVYKDNPLNHRLENLLQCISEICCVADDKLYPNTYVSNARDFDRWCEMSLMAIKEVSDLHNREWDKLFPPNQS